MFRERGLDGVGLAELMERANLTHGGFYRHFTSRDALITEAVEAALADGSAIANAIASHPKSTIGPLIDAYSSLAHRDHVAASCAVTTLANDVARSNENTRTAYTTQVERYIALIERLVAHLPLKKRRAAAVAALATLVGAVSMARAVNDPTLSREILKSAADTLKKQLV
ncbi:MAG TPA: TetR/AcrR family transcriptional regulator [Kofleriaceae bacterium]